MPILNATLFARLLVAGAVGVSTNASAQKYRLNDTGVQDCIVAGEPTTDCDGTWSDADFGRDSTYPNGRDGAAGFSFTKLDATGADLEPDALQWSCIRDNTTGLIWENKTSNGNIHDRDQTFDNNGAASVHPVSLLTDASNSEKLCDYTDWRIPSRRELWSITYGYQSPNAYIDERYFANTAFNQYWTGTPYRRDTFRNFWAVDFRDLGISGRIWHGNNLLRARAVRSDQGYGTNNFIAEAAEVTDRATALIWRRCAEGQTWAGTTCGGAAVKMQFQEAIDYSKQQSLATGLMWRLPNSKELDSIVDTQKKTQPTIDLQLFPRTPADLFYVANGVGITFRDGRIVSGFAADAKMLIRLVRNMPRGQ